MSTPPLEELRTYDLVPYETLLDAAPVAVMLGHLDVPGLTEPGLPTSLSPATLRLLREDYGFNGVVMTDDLSNMGAVSDRFGLPDAVVASLAAGVDMALWAAPGRDAEVLDRLVTAVEAGELTEARVNESVARVLALKAIDPCTLDIPPA